MQKKQRVTVLVVACICGAFLVPAAMLGTEFWLGRRYTPPVGANRKSLPIWCPQRTGEVEINVDGTTVYVVFGPQPLFPITERPPGYVFADTGELIAWSPEALDNDRHSKYWNAARNKLIDEEFRMQHKK